VRRRPALAHALPLAVLTLQLAAVITIALRHEFWRDEVRALSLVKESPTPWGVFHNLHNEGHPILWYLALLVTWTFSHSSYALPVASIGIATAANWLFLKRAPFPFWQRALFVFGNLPLYEYAVMARSYGTVMLSLFAVAAVYPKRFERPVWFGVVVALAANTSAYVTPLLGGLVVALLCEVVVTRQRALLGKDGKAWLIIAAIALVGVAFATLTAYPDKTNIATPMHRRTMEDVYGELRRIAVEPGRPFGAALSEEARVVWIHTAAFWVVAACLLFDASLLVWLFLGLVGLSMMFFIAYHPAGNRHNGIFIIFIVTLLWVRLERLRDAKWFWRALPLLVMTLLCADQIYVASQSVRFDWNTTLSSCRAFGAYLRHQPRLANAIIIGEPDYMLEALPYYAGNDVYLAREQRYRKFASFTTANRASMSLDEILATARTVKEQSGRPVLIVVAAWLDLEARPPYSHRYSYNRTFRFSAKGIQDFWHSTRQLGVFRFAHGDENFTAYELL
jgi:hypothetical protein